MPLLKSKWAQNYFDWLLNNRNKLYFVFGLMTFVSLGLSTRLKLKTDFATLLPDKLESVKNLKLAIDRIGGTGALLIGSESPSFAANKKFMNDLAVGLKPLVGQSLRYYEYKYHESRSYLHTYGLHYLSNPQLEKFQKYLLENIEKEKNKSVNSFLGLDNDDDNKSETSGGSLEGLNPQLAGLLKYPDAYLGSPDGKILVMYARPLSSSLGVGQNKEILGKIKEVVHRLNPASYHPKMFVGYGGNVVSSIEEVETVKADLLDTAILLIVLILTILFLFIWSWRLILLMICALVMAVLWTFGLTDIFIGYLNTQTAFLGSLVVGTGINYGVILVCRYLENRRSGHPAARAIVEAMQDTLVATLVACATTVIAFVTLFLAENKGLSQFGFIGSIGIALSWILAYTVLPLWIYQWETRRPTSSHHNNPLAHFMRKHVRRFGHFIIMKYQWVLGIGLVLSVVSGIGVWKLFQNPLEHNFDNLRNRISKDVGVAAFEKKMQATLPTSRTPAPLLLQSEAEAREACGVVEEIAKKIPPEHSMIHQCMSLYKMLPPRYEWNSERRLLFEKIKATLKNPLLKYSSEADNLYGIRDNMSNKVPTMGDLPEEVKVRFREKNGQTGLIAFVSPRPDKTLSDSRHLFDFVNALREIPLSSSGRVISAVGDSFVLADLFQSVPHDALVVGTAAFLGAILVSMFLAGGIRAGLLMAACLILGTLWMMGLQGFEGTKYNFFNFIALPLTFGIGIDYPINIYIRCKQENFRNYPKILVGSGVAVILASLTTIIGYVTLLGATNQALVSFAQLALIGEITCVATAIFILPALLRVFGHLKEPEATFWERKD